MTVHDERYRPGIHGINGTQRRVYPFTLRGGPHDGMIGEVATATKILSIPFAEAYDGHYKLIGYGDMDDGTRVLIYQWTEDKP